MTMKNIKYYFILLLIGVMSSCQDFEELEKNENKPAEVPASLVLNGILNDMYERPWSLEQRQNQYWCCNYNYYGTNEYWTSGSFYGFEVLKNVVKMEDEAKRAGGGEVNPYSALGKFFRAYALVRMTQQMGDIPMTQALKGLEEEEPAYDSQKEVYVKSLDFLTTANDELAQLIAANDATLAGDFYLNNDLKKWQKVVNTFKLRILISLSKKENDPDLNVKAKFAEVVNDPAKFPVMESLDDNVQYEYNGTTNLYPTNAGNRGFDKGRYNTAATYLNTLASLSDPRTYVTANPAKKKLNNGLDPADFAAYVGAPSGENLADMTFKAGQGEYSFVNQARYYSSTKGPEPSIQIGYPEMCFTIAEGINRGWVPGKSAADAESFYVKGIRASMEFYGLEDGAEVEITESDNDKVLKTVTVSVTSYLNQAAVKYNGNNATGLQQILTQKYLAFFQHSGLEAYFNFRRTGIPAFHQGPGTGNGGVIPRRWLYPGAEKNVNTNNLNAAIANQFGGAGDDLDNEMWLLKN
jgi:hypothetical protein